MGMFDDFGSELGSMGGALPGNTGDTLSQVPFFGGMFDPSKKQAMDQLRQNQELMKNISLPELKWQNYTPEAYNAENAQATTVSEDPMVRSAQLSALAKMGNLADTGLSAVDQAGYQNAANLGNQMAHSGNQAAMNDAQARGVYGSGLEFANREMANQQGAQRAQESALQQAADSARQRALYQQAYGSQLGQQRAQDFNANSTNAGILNNFNMANTNARNAAQQYNVGNQNQATVMNQTQANNLAQQNFNNQITKVGGQAQANTGMADAYAATNANNQAQRNANTKMGMDLAKMAAAGG